MTKTHRKIESVPAAVTMFSKLSVAKALFYVVDEKEGMARVI